ncbi:hypothetical protein HDU76_010934, partial [Blyttiomyces sp. JEL0837]
MLQCRLLRLGQKGNGELARLPSGDKMMVMGDEVIDLSQKKVKGEVEDKAASVIDLTDDSEY